MSNVRILCLFASMSNVWVLQEAQRQQEVREAAETRLQVIDRNFVFRT
jgi:hypothetical protein